MAVRSPFRHRVSRLLSRDAGHADDDAAEFNAVEDLTLRFGERTILDGISFTAPHGKRIVLTGPDGCGKTSLLRCNSGALTPDTGRIRVNGRPLADYSVPQLSRELAVVSQFENTIDQVKVIDQVLLGCGVRRSHFSPFSAEDHRFAEECLALVGMAESKDRMASTLSGGERQRVLIARALAQKARGMLLDEPTNHLDMRYQHGVLGRVTKTVSSQLIVLHDLNMVARYSALVIVLDGGRMVAFGHPDDVLTPELIFEVYGMDAIPVTVNGIRQFVFDTKDGAKPHDIAVDIECDGGCEEECTTTVTKEG
ncbi:ABC transporter ATP-binding protein [Corynebacterium sp. 335C]